MNENRKKSIQSNKIEFSGYIRPGKKKSLGSGHRAGRF